VSISNLIEVAMFKPLSFSPCAARDYLPQSLRKPSL